MIGGGAPPNIFLSETSTEKGTNEWFLVTVTKQQKNKAK